MKGQSDDSDGNLMDQGSKRSQERLYVLKLLLQKRLRRQRTPANSKLNWTLQEKDFWKKMEDKDKEFDCEYNTMVKYGDTAGKVTMPKGSSVKTKVGCTPSCKMKTYVKRE
jgi:hypothetical protein